MALNCKLGRRSRETQSSIGKIYLVYFTAVTQKKVELEYGTIYTNAILYRMNLT